MGATYEVCGREILERLEKLMVEFHAELVEAEVTVNLLFAHAPKDEDTGLPMGPALQQNGYPCAGLTKITSLKDRVKGMADAEILIDGDEWPELAFEEQQALLDHELEHLQLKRKEGVLQVDALRRPLLRLKKHDFSFGWFTKVAERWKEASYEVKQAMEMFVGASGQYLFPFAKREVSVDLEDQRHRTAMRRARAQRTEEARA